jgi:hypothetical protein
MSAEQDTEKGLGHAPAHDRPEHEHRAFVARAYGLPAGYRIGRVTRHGGNDDNALTVEISPPGDGASIVIRYDEERLCRNAETLRGQAARDTDGLTRGGLIVGKAAQAVYEALCTLAAAYDRDDQRWRAEEWVQELRAACKPIAGHSLERGRCYDALRVLQRQRYTKGVVESANAATAAGEDHKTPQPPVLLDESDDGREHIANSHLGVFIRYQLNEAERLSDSKIAGLIVEIGGARRRLQAWNVSRSHKVSLVLIRLPDPPIAAEDGA